jgi:uncharacterized surface protein with fasciclin (FAS1) repeats
MLFVAMAMSLLAVVPAFAQDRPSIPELLANDTNARFTTLLAAVEAAGLGEALSGEGPFTVLAPTNDAFAAALENLGLTADQVLADTDLLTAVLTYHVIPGQYFFRNLTSGPELETLQGGTVQFALESGVFTVNGLSILDVDNVASNGIVHVIEDGVLLPDMSGAAAAQPDATEAPATQVSGDAANIRVAHLSADAGAVDVYVDGELTELTGVTFTTVSDWMQVPAGSYGFAVAPTGDEPSGVVRTRVEAGSWTTIAAIGLAANETLQLRFLSEDYSALAEGQARISVFHAVPFLGPVDILVAGAPLIVNLGYPGTLGDNDGLDIRDVPAGNYEVGVTAFGTLEPVLISGNLALEAGNNYFAAATGVPGSSIAPPQLVVVEAPVGQ